MGENPSPAGPVPASPVPAGPVPAGTARRLSGATRRVLVAGALGVLGAVTALAATTPAGAAAGTLGAA
ncbi:hypothetical protein AB0J39_39335, partial [Microbispora sp. NPDC049633]